MASAAIDAAFKAKLLASWSVCPVVGGSKANDLPETLTEPPTNVDAFLVVQYPVVDGDKPVLNGRYWDEGGARLVLNVKREVGQTQALAWADTLRGLFREYKSGSFETFVPDPPIVNDATDDGNWLSYSVIVPFRYQFNS